MMHMLFTAALTVAFLSAGAFAHTNHVGNRLADTGSVTVYMTHG